MLLVPKMNLDEREEGEITEYEDISSDEEIILRQRIAEIEELATLSNKVDEKENTNGRRKKQSTEIVALTKVKASPATVAHFSHGHSPGPRRSDRTKAKTKPAPPPIPKPPTIGASLKKRQRQRRSKRLRRHSCQLIISDDEFDSYDPLPLGTENLSPDPLPMDSDDDVVHVLIDENHASTPAEVIVIDGNNDDEEEDDEDDDLELKLRLEALQSKQEIKNDLQVILDQTQKQSQRTEKSGTSTPVIPACPAPPQIDEEQELRLIALKSAIVKKHLMRKKRKAEDLIKARPYSPTDDALENFDVPSPPMCHAQNMDISPLGTPSPFSPTTEENHHPVDMEIANDESQSPIFFSCTINTEPADPVAKENGTSLSHMEIQLDPSTMVADSGYDDEDPDKLRAFLLKKIGEAAQRKSMKVESDSLTDKEKTSVADTAVTDAAGTMDDDAAHRVTEHRHSVNSINPEKAQDNAPEEQDDEDEHVLRANLLSKAKQFKRARSEEAVSKTKELAKPLSEILSEQSKKVMELKTICRIIDNDNRSSPIMITEPIQLTKPKAITPPSATVPAPVVVQPMIAVASSPKPVTPTRNALISQLRVPRVNPVIISLRASDQDDSTSEYEDDDEDEEEESYIMDVGDNSSPLSIAMDSPQYSSSPVPMMAGERSNISAQSPGGQAGLNFDAKLSEFLKKARQSTGAEGEVTGGVVKLPMKKIVTKRAIVKKVVGLGKTVGLGNAIQANAAPAAVKHLPPSTQLEYNRLINRMHQLERQKLMRSKKEEPKIKSVEAIKAGDAVGIKSKPSPIKAPSPPLPQSPLQQPPAAPITESMNVIRKMVDLHPVEVPVNRTPITVLVHNDKMPPRTMNGDQVTIQQGKHSPAPSVVVVTKKVPAPEERPKGGAAAVTSTTSPTGGRITLKDRLKSLTAEQMKMLLDVQQRKVVNKRKNLNQSLDAFLGTMKDTMAANRHQIRVELEVRRLRRMLKLREQQLVEQRQLCSGQLHERLQSQYKAVAVARQSLATTSSQCLEVGKSVAVTEKEFRLTDEGSEGLGAKFRKYKAEIETYKELRGKIKQGVFTIADLKGAEEEEDKVEKKEEAPKPEKMVMVKITADTVVVDQASSKPKDKQQHEEGVPVVDNKTADKEEETVLKAPEVKEKETTDDQSKQLLGTELNSKIQSQQQLETNLSAPQMIQSQKAVEVKKQSIPIEEKHTITNGKPDLSFPVYKSPLEHMEFIDTANPNGILCPFQLNGTCQDEKCSYRHLASSATSSSVSS